MDVVNFGLISNVMRHGVGQRSFSLKVIVKS